jgi:hypothetical protein
MNFTLLRERYSVCRYGPEEMPSLDFGGQELMCVARTTEETSVVCRSGLAVGAARVEDGWRALRIEGPLDFGLVGILAAASGLLAEAGVSIFAISTFDTDYILVKEARLEDAVTALRAGGHAVGECPAGERLA